MKKVVLVFGGLSGLILVIMFAINFTLMKTVGFEVGEVLGWTSILISMSFIFFGIRSYREHYTGGIISFGKAFQVGILIALMASAIYVLSWEVIYNTMMNDFYEKYTEHIIEKMKHDNASGEAIEAVRQKMAVEGENYKKPLFRMAWTFIEYFPVGLIVTLICSLILKKKQKPQQA